jgi:16S rRNA (guanine966-N2)-methyltransferase
LRIVAGELKGRKLVSPAGNQIRPTSDKVKEAVFSMLMQYTPDAVVLDLFSGTGSLGLEALSRGAKRVYFADSSKESVNLTKRNIEICKSVENTVCMHGDWSIVLRRLREKFDIIFLDPPYQEELIDRCIGDIRTLDLLKPKGIIVVEHGEKQIMPEGLHGFDRIKEKKYGDTYITIYTH